MRRLAPCLLLCALVGGRALAQDVPALLDPQPAASPPQSGLQAVAPFHFAADAQTRVRAENCLASAIYYEAGNQPRDGQEAVAQVVLNRVRHPNYPKSVCGVVYQGAEARGCQFTFACDGSLSRAPDARGWRAALAVADRALDGFVAMPVGASTHYHTLWVHPAWSAAMTPTQRIGAHQFYRLTGGAAALTAAYAGLEPAVAQMTYPPASRRVLTAMAASVDAAPSPQAAPFTAWGLQIAVVTPGRRGALQVSQTGGVAGGPAPTPEPASTTVAGAAGS